MASDYFSDGIYKDFATLKEKFHVIIQIHFKPLKTLKLDRSDILLRKFSKTSFEQKLYVRQIA